MRIIGVDPGDYTGVAVWHSDDPWAMTTHEMLHGEVPPYLKHLVAGDKPDLVCEMFTISQRTLTTKISYVPLELIGWMRYQLANRGKVKWTPMTPSTTKHTAPDTSLRAVGWFRRTKDGHANDAARLVLAHMLINRLGPWEEMARMIMDYHKELNLP